MSSKYKYKNQKTKTKFTDQLITRHTNHSDGKTMVKKNFSNKL